MFTQASCYVSGVKDKFYCFTETKLVGSYWILIQRCNKEEKRVIAVKLSSFLGHKEETEMQLREVNEKDLCVCFMVLLCYLHR